MNLEEHTILVDGLQVAYTVQGNGMPVFVLHGWGSSSDSWKNVQDMLANAGFQVFVPDLPGFGKTPPPPSAWGVGEYTACVEKFARAIGISAFSLVGHSFGGQIAVSFASSHPSLVAKLVLVATAAIRPKPGILGNILSLLSKGMNRALVLVPSARTREWILRKAYAMIGRHDYGRARGIMREVFKKVVRQDLAHLLPFLSARTLIVWGSEDRLTPLAHGLRIKAAMPNASLKVFKGNGHNLHKEIPEELAQSIVAFLRP